jgi:predicted nuclease with TOPRIM domain
MNLFRLILKWIGEHFSASTLRDHNALLKEKNTQLDSEKTILQARIKQLQDEKAALELKMSELQILLEDATKQIKILESFRVKHPQAVQRIQQLESANKDLERQLFARHMRI